MSPTQRLGKIARTPVPGWLVLLGALLPFVAAAAGTARAVRDAVRDAADTRYALAESLKVHQQDEALQHRTDSLVIDAKFMQLAAPVNALYRACQRKRECP